MHRKLSAVGFLALLVIVAAALVIHVRGYFFLYDDFALVRQAADFSVAGIFTNPLFGFYRPLPFLLTRVQFFLFGWDHPALYAGIAISVHLANAALVGLLARRLGLRRENALLAAGLFALCAPAAEAYFWLSGVFDRLSVTAILAALLAGHECVSSRSRRQALAWGSMGLVATAMALLSKETAVVLPVLELAMLGTTHGREQMGRIGAYLAAIAVCVVIVLVRRHQLLPVVSGAYGDWRGLMLHASLVGNAGSYALALIRLPLPGPEAHSIVQRICGTLSFLLAATWIVIAARLARHRPLLLTACLVAITAALFPVMWAAVAPGTSASGRFLYLPGVWLALLPAAAVDIDEIPYRRLVPTLVEAAVALAMVCQTASVLFQAQRWNSAAEISRSAIDWMRPYQALDRSLFIANFPGVFLEGPYVLKDYAFSSYFGSGFKPRIHARQMSLRLIAGRAWFAGWMDQETARPDEHTVTLRLPIEQPAATPRTAVLSPAQGARVEQPFLLSGWTADTAAPFGCGVNVVHVYAIAGATAPLFLGATLPTLRSPDAARVLGSRYSSCGWSMPVHDLPPGSYEFALHPQDDALGGFAEPARFPITIVGHRH